MSGDPPEDDTPLASLKGHETLAARLGSRGYATVGDVRRASDRDLLRISHFGRGRLAWVRRELGPYIASDEDVERLAVLVATWLRNVPEEVRRKVLARAAELLGA